ncbi:MAG: glycosyl hydrolase [Bacteroidales bacterium]|nr:glycosyl hydrolase [Bacteroidales bacterium]
MRKNYLLLVVCLFFFGPFAKAQSSDVTLQCDVQPVYLYNRNKAPARLVVVKIKGRELKGTFSIQVRAENKTEQTEVVLNAKDSATVEVLLPENAGVKKECKAVLSVRHKKEKIRQELLVPPMRYWNIYLYNHSHVDIGYTNTHKNVELLHKTNIIEGIKLAQETAHFPEGSKFVWNPEVTWPLERLWTSNPELRDTLLNAIQKGQLGIDASYLNLNTSICSDEELFHIFGFSREMQRLTGKTADVFQQIDIPGISWGIIPVMAQEGVKYIMCWPNNDRAGNARNGIDGYPFWWVGPDGVSKVLFLQPGMYANSGSAKKGGETGRPWFGQRDNGKVPPFIKTGHANVDFTSQLINLEKEKYPYDFLVLSWSLWDNSPLDADVPHAVKEWNEKYAYPRIIISGGHEIMSMIEQKYGDRLPTVTGDYTEYWTDGLGTAAKLTALNRNAKEKLVQAETVWSMLYKGKAAPRAEFDEAWRYIALGSEHTWCFENPADPFFQDAIWKVKQSYFHEAAGRAAVLLDEALAPVTDKSNGAFETPHGPSNGGIAVFNTQSWTRSGTVVLSKAESLLGDRVLNAEGKAVPSQRLSTGELLFIAQDIPAFGSRHYRVAAGKSTYSNGCRIAKNTLENEHLKVTIDTETGNIVSFVRKADSTYNYIDRHVNKGGNSFNWLPANIDAPEPDSVYSITVMENGPLVAEIRIDSKAKGCRSVSRTVRLTAGLPWMEITNVVDKLPLVEKDGIHFGFGFNIPNSKTRVDIPWGIMEMEKDQWPQGNRNWIALQRWLDISNDAHGVTWCSLDAPLFEYGGRYANISLSWGSQGPWLKKLEPSSTIYSWVMNNHWHTNFPLTQDGPVTFRYRILPHDKYDAVAANRFGVEQAQPLVHVPADKDPSINPLIAIDNEKVVVTILKSSDKDGSMTVRLRSLSDRDETVNLSFPERRPEKITVKPYSLTTLKIEPLNKNTVLYEKNFNSVPVSDLLLNGAGSYTAEGLNITQKGNIVKLNKFYALAERMVQYKVKFSTDAKAVFKSSEGDFNAYIDVPNRRISIATNPATEKTVDFLQGDRAYTVEIYHVYQQAKVRIVDEQTGEEAEITAVHDGQGGVGQGALQAGFSVGMQWDHYCFGLVSGTSVLVKQMSVYALKGNVKLLVYGDSITQPEGYFPTADFPLSWTQRLIGRLNGNAVSSGRSGGNINTVLEYIRNELPFVKAQYVMVTIGTNGGNTEANLSELVEYIQSQGAIPILNNIPCNESGTQVAVNAVIEQVRRKYGVKGCKFDLVTSLAGDGREVDKTTMYWENYTNGWGEIYHHPNEKGGQKMFERTLIDLPELYE